MNADELLPLVRMYDLRIPGTWQQAIRDRSTRGKLYTEDYTLDLDHVVLVFRSGGERWRAWERVRAQWILGELAA
jgi:hypothetical protein